MGYLEKKVRNLRILVCVLLFLTSFQSVLLYLISEGRVPSLVIIKEVILKEDNNTKVKRSNETK